MSFNNSDINILRDLAKQKLDLAKSEENARRIQRWKNTNDLISDRPPVLVYQLPWHEMNIDNELSIKCENPFCRQYEYLLRQELYLYRHIQDDRVLSPYIPCSLVMFDSGFGIEEIVDSVATDSANDIISRHFNIQIACDEDIEKLKSPKIEVDMEQSTTNLQKLQEIFGSVINVQLTGLQGEWFTPWDNLVRLTGVEELMIDLIERPEYINRLVERFVDLSIQRLVQYSRLGIWASNNTNVCVGSGGYGYTANLCAAEKNLVKAPVNQLWGCGNAQIFSSVSPQMHWEFSLKHEIRYLSHFGLNYYGCCEPLHHKFNILQKIPNLRKISMSPWARLDIANEWAKGKYVLSCKPNPSIFASGSWDIGEAKKQIEHMLNQTKGCSVEIIMKDVSTVHYQPQRVFEWSQMVKEVLDYHYS